MAKRLVLEAVDDDVDDIYMEIALTEQVTSVVDLIYCPVMLIFEGKCPLIFYRKYF